MKKPLLRGYLQGMSRHFLSPYNDPEKISCRVSSRLTADHISALFPDVDSSFRDIEDVVDRLLPYHVFQHPREDLLKAGKGKRKATETEILRSEVAGAPVLRVRCCAFAHTVNSETKFALECFKRQRELEERFRRARTKSGKACSVVYFCSCSIANCASPAHGVRRPSLLP